MKKVARRCPAIPNNAVNEAFHEPAAARVAREQQHRRENGRAPALETDWIGTDGCREGGKTPVWMEPIE